MRKEAVFPALMVQFVSVGEESGTISEDLRVLSKSYEQEADRRTARILRLLQPCMLMLLGLVVGFIAISVITPMYTAMDVVG
jgi:type IV pilus assembly protein PilC